MRLLFLILSVSYGFVIYAQEPALPNIKSHTKTRDFTISSTLNEAYFTIQSPNEELSGIFKSIKTKGVWQPSVLVSFSGRYKDLEPHLSPDGLSLYFASNRPLFKSETKLKDFDIWVVTRNATNEPWSEPKNLGTPINTEHNEFYPAVSNSRTLYFTSDRPSAIGKDDIFMSKWNNGKYNKVKALSESINTVGYEFNAYIAPDESFIIFSGYNRKDGLGSGDLYISFKNTNGTWTQARNMGETVNSNAMDYCPFVDRQRKTLYFTSRRSAVRPTEKLDTHQFLKEISSYSNGLSRIYKVEVSTLLQNLKD
ncbi:MAG: TolB family protein [Flavobacteriaceae bacterium]